MPSTKPSAATVLPAPVACSNQKRRAAPGSSGCSGSWSSSTSSAPLRRPRRSGQSSASGSSSSSSSSSSSNSSVVVGHVLELVVLVVLFLVLVLLAGRPVPLPFWRSASAISAVSVPDSASTWCADSTVPSASFGSSSASSRSSPSISEYCWRHSTLGLLATGLDLRERGVECTPAGGARAQGVRIRRERLAGELLDALELLAGWNGRGLPGHFGGLSHFEACRNTWTPSHARRRRNARPWSAADESVLAGGSLRGPRDREAWLT